MLLISGEEEKRLRDLLYTACKTGNQELLEITLNMMKKDCDGSTTTCSDSVTEAQRDDTVTGEKALHTHVPVFFGLAGIIMNFADFHNFHITNR